MITLSATATLNPGPVQVLLSLLRAPPQAEVGIPASDPENAAKGIWNEFGTNHAPARSFMVSTATMYRRVYAAGLTASVASAVRTGKAATARKGVETAARLYHRDILRRIDSGIRPPNAPATLARKSGTTPLIDTGAMRRAILWRMR